MSITIDDIVNSTKILRDAVNAIKKVIEDYTKKLNLPATIKLEETSDLELSDLAIIWVKTYLPSLTNKEMMRFWRWIDAIVYKNPFKDLQKDVKKIGYEILTTFRTHAPPTEPLKKKPEQRTGLFDFDLSQLLEF